MNTVDIEFWESRIKEIDNPELIRRFYTKIGKANKIKRVFLAQVKKKACPYGELDYVYSIQYDYEQKTFSPEVSSTNLETLATSITNAEIKKWKKEPNILNNLFDALEEPVFAKAKAQIPDETLKQLVNFALTEGTEGESIGENTSDFITGLIQFPQGTELEQELDTTFNIVKDDRYFSLADVNLVKKIVTAKVFREFIYGDFAEAIAVKNNYSQYYDEELIKEFGMLLLSHVSFKYDKETYPLEFVVQMLQSELGSILRYNPLNTLQEHIQIFEDWYEQNKDKVASNYDFATQKSKYLAGYQKLALAQQITNFLAGKLTLVTEEMNQAVSEFKNERVRKCYTELKGEVYPKSDLELDLQELNKAYDLTFDDYHDHWGVSRLNHLLKDEAYVKRVGLEKIKYILQERTDVALKSSNVYGILISIFGRRTAYHSDGVANFCDYVSVEYNQLLDKLIDQIKPSSDHNKIDEIYQFYLDQRSYGYVPSSERTEKLLMSKINAHFGNYSYHDVQKLSQVFDDPANAKYLDPEKVKDLLNATITKEFCSNGWNTYHAQNVSCLYALVNTKIGELVRDNPKIKKYFALREFLQS